MDQTTAGPDVSSVISDLERLSDRFAAGMAGRLDAVRNVPAELENLRASLAAGGTLLSLLLFQIVLVVGIVTGVFFYLDLKFKKASIRVTTSRRVLAGVAAGLVALVIGLILARLLAGSGVPLQTLRLWTVVTVLGFVILAAVRSLLMASRQPSAQALRPSGGAGARPVVRHCHGDHRRYAAGDIAALEHRARTGGSAANRFGDSDLPSSGRVIWRHRDNGRRCRRSAPEKPLAHPSRQNVAGNRDRVPDHHLSQHPGRPDLGNVASWVGRTADGVDVSRHARISTQ